MNLKEELGFSSLPLEEFQLLESDNFDQALSQIQMVISEISRYAINDLFNRIDDNERIPFHTRSFHLWVEQKVRSKLLPLGVSEEWIKRALLCTLGMNYGQSREEEKWEKDDQYADRYLEIGEIFRVGEGRNIPTPDRFIEINNLVCIISSKPTLRLYEEFRSLIHDFQIEHVGMMRFMRAENIDDTFGDWSRQPIENFLSIPPMIYDILRSGGSRSVMRQSFLKQLEFRRFQELNDFRNSEQDSTTNLTYAFKEGLSFSYSFNGRIPSEPRVIGQSCAVQHRMIRQQEQYSPNVYFFTHQDGGGESFSRTEQDSTRLYFIDSVEAPYVLRLFNSSERHATLSVQSDNTFNLTKYPTSSGRRLLMMFGCKRVLEDGRFRGTYSLRNASDLERLSNLLKKWNLYEVLQ